MSPLHMTMMLQVTLDSELGCSWHCVVGETFGFSLDLEEGAMLYLFYGSLAILVWKCGTQLLKETRWTLHTCTWLSGASDTIPCMTMGKGER